MTLSEFFARNDLSTIITLIMVGIIVVFGEG